MPKNTSLERCEVSFRTHLLPASMNRRTRVRISACHTYASWKPSGVEECLNIRQGRMPLFRLSLRDSFCRTMDTGCLPRPLLIVLRKLFRLDAAGAFEKVSRPIAP